MGEGLGGVLVVGARGVGEAYARMQPRANYMIAAYEETRKLTFRLALLFVLCFP